MDNIENRFSVLAETEHGKITYVTYELLDAGKELADKTMTESISNGKKIVIAKGGYVFKTEKHKAIFEFTKEYSYYKEIY